MKAVSRILSTLFLYTILVIQVLPSRIDSYYHPYVKWESKLQQCLNVNIHAMEKTGSNSKIQIYPSNEDCQNFWSTYRTGTFGVTNRNA